MTDAMKRAAEEAEANLAAFAGEVARADATTSSFRSAVADARADALAFLGPGSPESVWTRYEEENGPLADIDHQSVVELLWYQLQWASLLEERTLRIPRPIALHMLLDLTARRDGRSIRPRHRPRRSQLALRYQAYAVAHVRARKLALIQAGEARGDALERALDEIAQGHKVSRETLRTWMKNPARLHHAK